MYNCSKKNVKKLRVVFEKNSNHTKLVLFQKIRKKINLITSLKMVKKNACVFISGKGSNLKNLIKKSRDYNFPINISLYM